MTKISTRWIMFLFSGLFVGSLFAQSEVNIAKEYIKNNKAQFNMADEDLREMKVSDFYYQPITNTHHIYFQQVHHGIEVYNAIFNTAQKNGVVNSCNTTFVPELASKVNASLPALSAKAALQRAAAHINLDGTRANELRSETMPNGQVHKVTFDNGGISIDEIPAQLYWMPNNDNTSAKLAWNIRIQTLDSKNWWNIRVDAATGEILDKNNWVTSCNFDAPHRHSNKCEAKTANNTQKVDFENRVMANTYNVFDIPLESPNHGARTLVSSPYTRFVPTGTGPGVTNGWHQGTAAYTYLRGNSTWAYEDATNPTNDTKTVPASTTLDFNYSYTQASGTAAANQNAAVTNLFYWNNLIHDVLYRYGFNEVAGNFQTDNMSRGGTAGDHVFAEAQDNSGTDNANFSTPVDGGNGRMQMYLWLDASLINFQVNSPSGIAGVYNAVESGFSTANKIAAVGPITQNLVEVIDNTAPTSDACETITNGAALTGKVALLDRGVCSFTIKVKAAQVAGAVAAIVCNNAAGSPITMGGTDNTITIPAFMISQSDCAIIRAQLAAGVNVTLSGSSAYQPDGDFDNGIISHEYGHGWSIRLAGGPSNSSCLNNAEQMGEGWGDFLGLMLATNWAGLSPSLADANKGRGIGTYAMGQSIAGGGIRPYPYSYDMTNVNGAVTYGKVADATNFSQPHGIGSIWCTIIWDMTWEIIMQDQFIEPDIWNVPATISSARGNVAAFKLVHEGLILQPCSPSFVSGRDAILQADQNLFCGRYRAAIWRAFARRGVGSTASTGTSTNDRTITENFTVPADISVPTTIPTAVGTYTATDQATDATGWTHYWDDRATTSTGDDLLLLSIKHDGTLVVCPSQVTLGITAVAPTGQAANLTGVPYKSTSWFVMDRYWNVTPTTQPSAAGVDVRFYYTSTDYTDVQTAVNAAGGAISTHADLEFFKFASGSGVNPSPASMHSGSSLANYIILPHTSSLVSGSTYKSQFHVASFSGGGGGGGPLPVELINFTATANKKSITLNWATASELNNKGFEVMRSSDATTFAKVGWVNGNGTSANRNDYQFEDKDVVAGKTYYYFLNQVDRDGASNQTATVSARIDRKVSVQLLPNPASGSVVVKANKASLQGSASISIKSIDGKSLREVTVDARELEAGYTLSLEGISKGVYIVELKSNDLSLVEKLVVE